MKCFNKSNMNKIYINKIVVGYILVFLLYSIVGRIIPLANMLEGSPNQIIYNLFAIIGVLLLIVDFVTERNMFKTRYSIILILFLFIIALSSLCNIQYGFSDNIKTLVWTSIQLLLIYTAYIRLGKEKIVSFVKSVFFSIVIVWLITAIVSIAQYFLRIGYYVEYAGMLKRQGFVDNRLFGIYNDPNYAAITALYVIVMSFYLFKFATKKYLKVLYIFSVLVQYIYIVLSGSRTAEICMMIVFVLFLLVEMRKILIKKHFGIFKNIVIIMVSMILSVSIFVSGYGTSKKVLGKIPALSIEKSETHISPEKQDILHRTDTEEGNISNNRFKIWGEYFKVMHSKKAFLGLSPRNSSSYIHDHHPGSYLDTTKYETHNAYLSLYVSTGIIGVGIVMILMGIILIRVLKLFLGKREPNELFVCALIIEMIVLVYAFFFSDLFFVNNLTTTIFWVLLGIVTENLNTSNDVKGKKNGK